MHHGAKFAFTQGNDLHANVFAGVFALNFKIRPGGLWIQRGIALGGYDRNGNEKECKEE